MTSSGNNVSLEFDEKIFVERMRKTLDSYLTFF